MKEQYYRDGFYCVEATEEKIVLDGIEYEATFSLMFNSDYELVHFTPEEEYEVGEDELKEVDYETSDRIEEYIEKHAERWLC